MKRGNCRRNLAENWERGGGAFAVYYQGEKVVDLWGGYADKESIRFWREDTMTIAFSTTKVWFLVLLSTVTRRQWQPFVLASLWTTGSCPTTI